MILGVRKAGIWLTSFMLIYISKEEEQRRDHGIPVKREDREDIQDKEKRRGEP